MNKKSSNGGWGILIIQLILSTGLLLIGLLSTPTVIAGEYENTYAEYLKVVNSYNDLRKQYSTTIDSCLATFQQCRTTLENAKSTVPVSDLIAAEEADLPGWRLYSGLSLLVLFAVISITLSAVQIYLFRKASVEREKQFDLEKKRENQRFLEEGRRETIKSIASELVGDKDVLSELTRWLTEYKTGEAEIDQSAYIHSQILTRLVKQIHLNPILKFNDVVSFDPDQHKTFDNLKPSEPSIVQEPGWRVGREVIKLPLVRRK